MNLVVRAGNTVRRPPEPFDELVEHRRKRLDQRGEWQGVVPREIIAANLDWAMDHAPVLSKFLA